MSQEIICTECQTANSPGSKFCNNCGAKLPLGTHIICSNCSTSNPIDRIFCDHCGTRLIPEEPKAEEEQKSEPPPAGKGFAMLPTRKPGETGDLDPRNVPDWLKTGQTGQEDAASEIEEEPDDQALPRVEELTQKKQTDDLPEWLVSDADSDPIIHAPTVISTEFYKDLLDKVEDAPQMDDLFPEEKDSSNLPDWLQDAGTEPSSASSAQTGEEDPTKGLTEFLSELPGEDEPSADFKKPASDSLTSWLSDVPEDTAVDSVEQGDVEGSGLTEWLQDAPDADIADESDPTEAESLTNWLTDDSSDTAVAEADSFASDGLTDWLEEDESDSAELLDFQDEAADADDGLTDWLSSVSGEEEESAAEIIAEAPDLGESLTGWLSELPDDDEEETAVAEPDVRDGLTDWFEDAPASLEEPEPEAAADINTSLTSWLSELPDDDEEEKAVVPEPEAFDEAEDVLDWSSIEEDDPAAMSAEDTSATAEAAGPLTDWLAADDELNLEDFEDSDAGAQLEDADFSSRLTDWLNEGDEIPEFSSQADLEQVADDGADDERLTDWLSDPAFLEEEEDSDDMVEASLDDESGVDRLAAWISGDEADEADEEEFGWLEEPESPVTASGKHEIPSEISWLEETEEELSNIFQSQPTIEEELPDWLADVAEDGGTFMSEVAEDESGDLEDIFQAEQIAAETELDFLHQTGSLHVDSDLAGELGLDSTDADDELFDDTIRSDEPDWLADLAQMTPEELALAEDDALTTAVDSADIDDEFDFEEALPPLPEVESDSFIEDLPDEEEIEEDASYLDAEGALPDWINQLDAPDDLPDVDDSELIPSEEMPDWVASLNPGQTVQDSVLPGALAEDMPETLAGIPEELAGSDLPDWLQDVPKEPAAEAPLIPVPSDTQISDYPDWLQTGLEQSEEDSSIFASSDADLLDPTEASGEWNSILNDLPPAVPIEDTLSKAEIPEWVMDLKPVELSGDQPKAAPVPEGPEETYGALSGLRGVVAVEPIIAQPRMAEAPAPIAVSPEQKSQVLLLRQLAQNGHETKTAKAARTERDISSWTRPLFAIILIAVIVLGLQGEFPFALPTTVPAALTGVDTAVASAADSTVLVAFEYSPAMAGELTPEAETLLAQLEDNGSNIIAVSQFASGVTIADEVIAETNVSARNLGYLPGGPVGLRRLGECLSEGVNCDDMFGQPLPANELSELNDVALIIVLTANRENLVGWIEQVGTPTGQEMVAGVTQSLYPIAAPYFDTDQLQGVINGIPGTAVYQAEYFATDQQEEIESLFNAEVAAQTLLFVVLLIGAVVYIISGFVSQRRKK